MLHTSQVKIIAIINLIDDVKGSQEASEKQENIPKVEDP